MRKRSNTDKNTMIFEHGLARIRRMFFATGLRNIVGICVREDRVINDKLHVN